MPCVCVRVCVCVCVCVCIHIYTYIYLLLRCQLEDHCCALFFPLLLFPFLRLPPPFTLTPLLPARFLLRRCTFSISLYPLRLFFLFFFFFFVFFFFFFYFFSFARLRDIPLLHPRLLLHA